MQFVTFPYYFFNTKPFLIYLLQFFFMKRSNNLTVNINITVNITNKICLVHGTVFLTFLIKKNLLTHLERNLWQIHSHVLIFDIPT